MNRSEGGSPWRRAGESVQLYFPNPVLESGLIVGHVTECSARIWVRCGLEADRPNTGATHRLLVWQHGRLIRDIPIRTRREADQTVVIDVDSLQPSTTYEVDLVGLDRRSVLPADLEARFRTQSDLSTWTRTCFGVVSCNLPYENTRYGSARLKANAAMLGEFRLVLEKEGADFVISMGDQVYADGPPSLDIWRYARERLGPDDIDGCRALYHQLYRGYRRSKLARSRAAMDYERNYVGVSDRRAGRRPVVWKDDQPGHALEDGEALRLAPQQLWDRRGPQDEERTV